MYYEVGIEYLDNRRLLLLASFLCSNLAVNLHSGFMIDLRRCLRKDLFSSWSKSMSKRRRILKLWYVSFCSISLYLKKHVQYQCPRQWLWFTKKSNYWCIWLHSVCGWFLFTRAADSKAKECPWRWLMTSQLFQCINPNICSTGYFVKSFGCLFCFG